MPRLRPQSGGGATCLEFGMGEQVDQNTCAHEWQVGRIKWQGDFDDRESMYEAGLAKKDSAYAMIVCLLCNVWERRNLRRNYTKP